MGGSRTIWSVIPGPRWVLGFGWALIALLFLFSCGRRPTPTTGAEVVECSAGEAADRAGLRPGDIVIGWRRGEHRAELLSPLQLSLVEQENSLRGATKLEVWRASRTKSFEIPSGTWGLRTQPVLGKHEGDELKAVEESDKAGDIDDAVQKWQGLARKLVLDGRKLDAAWCRMHAAALLLAASQEETGQRELQKGAALIEDSALRGVFRERIGRLLFDEGRMKAAEEAFRAALEELRSVDEKSPVVAFTLLELYRAGHRIHEAEAREALAIYSALGGAEIAIASARYQLASARYGRGDFTAAAKEARSVLAIVEAKAPGIPLHCELLGRLGLALYHQGDFDGARRVFHEEFQRAETLAPGTVFSGSAANNLGLVAKTLGQYREARSWYQRGLEIFSTRRPGGLEVAGISNNLGNLATKQEDFVAALRYHRDAYALRRKLDAPASAMASSLNNIGTIERRLGDLNAARRDLETAVILKRRTAPASLTLSNSLVELGIVASIQDHSEEAGKLYEEALRIRSRVVPNSPRVADVLFLQGSLQLLRGRRSEAERLWKKSINLIEATRKGLHISEDERSRFGASYYEFYVSLAFMLVDEGRAEEAFVLMERARARALRAMAFGAASVPAGVPPMLWYSYRRAQLDCDRTRSELARLGEGADREAVARLGDELRRKEHESAGLAAKIRACAPRLAFGEMIEDLDLDALKRSLDPATLVLSYLVGKDKTVLFMVGSAQDGERGELRTAIIPAGSEELRTRVDSLGAFIDRGHTLGRVDPALITQSRRLFALLIEPAMEELGHSRRLLIVPDGPLRELSFAALALPGEPLRYLGQLKSLVYDPSAGAWLALRRRAMTQLQTRPGVIAFADPRYPKGSVQIRSLHLGSLAGSRSEVAGIAALFGSKAEIYLGKEATENRFRSLQSHRRFLHFAVHARSNSTDPLESALYLSTPRSRDTQAENDGVLHAWEIMDGLHIEANVVTLSACSTARGEHLNGEGILGLARAFEYAGADTLVVSQWPVGDHATSELMIRFYTALRDGLNTADALKQAQEEFLQAPSEDGEEWDRHHPFFWAAFQVIGDWR